MRKQKKQMNMEDIYAAQIRRLKESYLAECQNRDGSRKTPETGGGDCLAQSRNIEKATVKEKVACFLKEWLSAAFYKDGKPVMLHFWATIFLVLIAVALVMKLFGVHHISDTLMLGLMGFVSILISIYSVHSSLKRKYLASKTESL